MFTHFESGVGALAAGLTKPRAQKKRADIHQRIGRLKQPAGGIGRHDVSTVTADETGEYATAITWAKTPFEGSMLTDPGVCCLRSNEIAWDAQTLSRTDTMLTNLEAVCRDVKSDLGLRPVVRHKADRIEGHLFITVLACQLVQALRRKLEGGRTDVLDAFARGTIGAAAGDRDVPAR